MKTVRDGLIDYIRDNEAPTLPGAFKAGTEFYSNQPTHYAVVDEYGEIVYARRICATLDAEAQCKHYIKLCDKDPVTRAHMNNWTIKGVTVNE